jgi:transposase
MARELHGPPHNYGAKKIAEALNVPRDTVRAWINPKRAKRSGRARKQAAKRAEG